MNTLHLSRVPIITRVLIANGLVIAVGAFVGTLLTKMLVDQSAFSLAIMFTAAGVVLSLILNYAVLRVVLRQLNSLTREVNAISEGGFKPDDLGLLPAPRAADPDIARLSQALDSMLERLAAHTATIEANREQLRALSAQVIKAQEEERKRIARELHDDTCQSLASLLLALERIGAAIPNELPEVGANIASAHVLVDNTLEGIRALVADLRPLLLDDLGLIPAIRWYAREHLESQGIDVQFQFPADMPRLPAFMEIALFRMAQEAITNIIRHADAGQVSVTMTTDCSLSPDCHVKLIVEDDGIGFDATGVGVQQANGHFGLFGISERVAALSGQVEIESMVGQGTRLLVDLPLRGESCERTNTGVSGG